MANVQVTKNRSRSVCGRVRDGGEIGALRLWVDSRRRDRRHSICETSPWERLRYRIAGQGQRGKRKRGEKAADRKNLHFCIYAGRFRCYKEC